MSRRVASLLTAPEWKIFLQTRELSSRLHCVTELKDIDRVGIHFIASSLFVSAAAIDMPKSYWSSKMSARDIDIDSLDLIKAMQVHRL